MHELSIAISLVDAAIEEARRLRVDRVDAVYLQLGALSGVVQEALVHGYEVACSGTRLEGSRLIIEGVPARIDCRTCGGVRDVLSIQCFTCASCGTPGTKLVQGRELHIVGLEVP